MGSRVTLMVLVGILTCCGGSLNGTVPAPSHAPSPSVPPPTLSLPELKYRVIDQVGPPWFCDPDYYPIARPGGEEAQVAELFPKIQADTETYQAILHHQHLPADGLSDQQKLDVYRQWKQLRTLELTPRSGGYGFVVLVKNISGSGQGSGMRVAGSVDQQGQVSVVSRQPAAPPLCPICLAARTSIATPSGSVQVTDLRPGDLVLTMDASGHQVPAPLLKTGSVPAPPGHVVVHLVLADGRSVSVSPGHPTADGREVGLLRIGDHLEGSVVVRTDRIPYTGRTFDILPDSSTATYWADGILLRSTLAGSA